MDYRLGVTLRAVHDGMDPGNQFVLIERLCQVVISTKTGPLTLSSMLPKPLRISIGVFTLETHSSRKTSKPVYNWKWKAKYGGLEVSEAKRLKGLESENAKLKKLLADAMLDNALKDLRAKKW